MTPTPVDLRLPGSQQRTLVCASTSPSDSCCSLPRSCAHDSRGSALLHFLTAARECVIMLPPCKSFSETPAACTPRDLAPAPEATVTDGRDREGLAQSTDQSSSYQQHKQPPQKPLPAVSAAARDELRCFDRQWQQEDGVGTALQFLSPLGGEAAFQQPRSSFEAKWGRWCVCTSVGFWPAPRMKAALVHGCGIGEISFGRGEHAFNATAVTSVGRT